MLDCPDGGVGKRDDRWTFDVLFAATVLVIFAGAFAIQTINALL